MKNYKRRDATHLERLIGIALNKGSLAAIRWALKLPMGWGKALILLGVLIAVGVRLWWSWGGQNGFRPEGRRYTWLKQFGAGPSPQSHRPGPDSTAC